MQLTNMTMPEIPYHESPDEQVLFQPPLQIPYAWLLQQQSLQQPQDDLHGSSSLDHSHELNRRSAEFAASQLVTPSQYQHTGVPFTTEFHDVNGDAMLAPQWPSHIHSLQTSSDNAHNIIPDQAHSHINHINTHATQHASLSAIQYNQLTTPPLPPAPMSSPLYDHHPQSMNMTTMPYEINGMATHLDEAAAMLDTSYVNIGVLHDQIMQWPPPDAQCAVPMQHQLTDSPHGHQHTHLSLSSNGSYSNVGSSPDSLALDINSVPSERGWSSIFYTQPQAHAAQTSVSPPSTGNPQFQDTQFNFDHRSTSEPASLSDVEYVTPTIQQPKFFENNLISQSSPSNSDSDLETYIANMPRLDAEGSPPALAITTVPAMDIKQARRLIDEAKAAAAEKPKKVLTPSSGESSGAVRPSKHSKKNSNLILGAETPSKKIGKRKGPLNPEQRKQASEIRKMGACIRCRFLKKTCDKGDPCAGCLPSHARLWLVPCTRLDIRDLGFFLKDYKLDYERHVSAGLAVTNIISFSEKERTLFITHGHGHALPLPAREVLVRDDKVFGSDWIETFGGANLAHEVETAPLAVGKNGISPKSLHKYLDAYIDGEGAFVHWIDFHFEEVPYLTEVLKIIHKYYAKDKNETLRRALKLLLAYSLTMTVTLVVEGLTPSEMEKCVIRNPESLYNGQVAAPVMINFQIKYAMGQIWRDLHRDVLRDLSTMFTSIYSSRDKLKNWPMIFMTSTLLMCTWEMMQFDCSYRSSNQPFIDGFCNDMENTPVGVLCGLFAAISQKMPPLMEWDAKAHAACFGEDKDVCEMVTEVKDAVGRHEPYLRARNDAKFDREDFDSLANKFMSKLVIRTQ